MQYGAELSAADCFEIGRQSYINKDYYHTLLWMREAGSRFEKENCNTINYTDILEYLAFSTYKQGDLTAALDLTNKLLGIIPAHPRALGNKLYYEYILHKVTKKKDDTVFPNTDYYEDLCRGEVSLPDEKIAKLKCRYLTNDNPYLLLAPFKVEEAHLNPDILIFYNVLGNGEIETIKRLAQPRVWLR